MAQKRRKRTYGTGNVFEHRGSWFLRYRHDVPVNGTIVRKQKCVRLADVCDRYRIESDLRELVKNEMSKVEQSAKCSHVGIMFVEYAETVFLPMVERTSKPSTYAAYKTYLARYIKPWAADYALRDFTKAIVSSILRSAANTYELNTETVKKIRSILSAVFSLAIDTGAYPARSEFENPASHARIPESASDPEPTEAATFAEVQAYLSALKGNVLARAAVAIAALTGVRPGEARGLRWEEWDRAERHIWVNRSIWHREVGTPKTEKSVRPVPVDDQLREILLDLWNAQGCPISGYILAGEKRKNHPVILDNLAKRAIRPTLEKAGLTWRGWYALRRCHGTEVRKHTNGDTMAKALGNTKEVANKHYLKVTEVLPDVRRGVTAAFSGLIQ